MARFCENIDERPNRISGPVALTTTPRVEVARPWLMLSLQRFARRHIGRRTTRNTALVYVPTTINDVLRVLLLVVGLSHGLACSAVPCSRRNVTERDSVRNGASKMAEFVILNRTTLRDGEKRRGVENSCRSGRVEDAGAFLSPSVDRRPSTVLSDAASRIGGSVKPLQRDSLSSRPSVASVKSDSSLTDSLGSCAVLSGATHGFGASNIPTRFISRRSSVEPDCAVYTSKRYAPSKSSLVTAGAVNCADVLRRSGCLVRDRGASRPSITLCQSRKAVRTATRMSSAHALNATCERTPARKDNSDCSRSAAV